jgi:hypothetical protein
MSDHTPTQETAVEATQMDDTDRGVKTYVIALLGLLAAITVTIVITSLLASVALD